MSKVCDNLHRLFSGLPTFGFPFQITSIPQNGIYVLFEEGESGHGGNRIVRVGTHTGQDQLRPRLQQHFLKENKDRSIFRKNVGRALLNKDKDPFLAHWEIDLTTTAAKKKYSASMDAAILKAIEARVTQYIQTHFRFVVFGVDDKNARLRWESAFISTVAACEDCGPSENWLGRHSTKAKIRESGLWLVNELYKQSLSDDDFATLSKIVLCSVEKSYG